MSKLSTLKTVAAAAGICATMMASGTAGAYSYGTSHLKVTDLRINAYNGTTNNVAQVTNYSFSQTNTATLNGAITPTTLTCGLNVSGAPACPNSNPVLNAAVATAPGSTVGRAENSFARVGFDGTNSYSHADSVLYTAELPSSGLQATSLELIAESLLNKNGTAQANASQNSTTSLTTFINVTQGGTGLTLNFKALADQLSANNGALGSYLAQTSMNVDFTLTQVGGSGSISWKPNGRVFNGITLPAPIGYIAGDCGVTNFSGVTCTELNDGGDLSMGTTTSGNPDTNQFDVLSSLFGIDIKGLGIGQYTLTLNAKVGTDLSRNVVPEPDALALLGIALAGLAFVTKRKSAKQA